MVIVQHLVDSKHSFDIDRIKLIEALVESSVDRIIVFTTAYRVIIWNRKCEEFYQLKKKDAIDRHFFNIFPTIRNDVELVDAIERAMQGKMVHLPPRKSIIRGYYESFFIPLNNEAEQAYGVLTVIHDITERIQAEEKLNELNDSLQRKNRELEAMNQELSSIAFVAGHDLSEPLRKIQVFSEAILKKESDRLSDSGKDYFNRIIKATRRMNALIDDILTFSGASSGNIKKTEIDLNCVLETVMDALQEKIHASKAVIESQPLPLFKGNFSQMTQLIQNLISNAIKFQKPGNIPRIRIEHSTVQGDKIAHRFALANRDYLCLRISDNGIGFDPQYSEKIFLMFQRLHAQYEYPGTGMGLAICKKVVENHNGIIIAQGEPGKGAAFTCYFPL